jgi:hypothetical protein
VGAWHLLVNGVFATQESVVVLPMSAAEIAAEKASCAAAEQAACAAARAAATYDVHISGATGENDWRVNGLYEVTDEVSGGMPVYHKKPGSMGPQRSELWLEYHQGRWMSRSTVYNSHASDYIVAYVDCAIGVLPDQTPTGAWYVEDDGIHESQPRVVTDARMKTSFGDDDDYDLYS